MPYVIVNHEQSNFIMLGPIQWNARYFSAVITDEIDEETVITKSQEDSVPLSFHSGSIGIYRCYTVHEDLLNPKIHQHGSPIWTFFEEPEIIDGVSYHAKATYPVVSKNVDVVKRELKDAVSAERWNRENKGVVLNIQGQEVWCDTARGNRDIFMQKYLLMGENDVVKWKFPSAWIDLTKSDLGYIVSAGTSYIQDQFNWESATVAEIDAATTVEELDSIVISTVNTNPPLHPEPSA